MAFALASEYEARLVWPTHSHSHSYDILHWPGKAETGICGWRKVFKIPFQAAVSNIIRLICSFDKCIWVCYAAWFRLLRQDRAVLALAGSMQLVFLREDYEGVLRTLMWILHSQSHHNCIEDTDPKYCRCQLPAAWLGGLCRNWPHQLLDLDLFPGGTTWMYNHCAGCFSHRLRHSPSQSPLFCKTVHNIFFSVNCRLRKLLPRNISVNDSILLHRIGFLIMYTMKFYADFESLKRKTQFGY